MEAGNPNPPQQPPPTEPTVAMSPEQAAESADPTVRLEGLRAWVAQLDRKLGTRFYALAAASVLALAAGIVAIVLALGIEEDSAKKAQVEALREDLAGVERSASTAADDEISALQERLADLESQVNGLRSDQSATDKEIGVVQDDISDLQDDVNQLESAPPADESSNDTNPDESGTP